MVGTRLKKPVIFNSISCKPSRWSALHWVYLTICLAVASSTYIDSIVFLMSNPNEYNIPTKMILRCQFVF